MKYHKLYTIGYSGLEDPAELARLAHGLKAGVVDIRFLPVSRRACWGLFELRSAMASAGVKYASLRELGNVNFREPSMSIVLKDPEVGMPKLLALLREGNQIILCGCKDFRACHRSTVGVMAEARGVEVIHYMREEKTGAEQIELF